MMRFVFAIFAAAVWLIPAPSLAALGDYDPVFQWYADSLADLDEPTGTSVSNPGSLTSPDLAGSPDSYADFDGADGITLALASPVLEVGTGDVTIVAKLRVDTFAADDYIMELFDTTGTTQTAVGYRLKISAAGSRRVALAAPPGSETITTGFLLETATNSLTAGQDFIVAFRRSSGTWTVWLDADASGGMAAETPNTNTLADAAFTEVGGPSFGARQNAAGPFDGRLYWIVGIAGAVNDTDIQLSDWDDEANLKSAWLSAGSPPTISSPTPSGTLGTQTTATLGATSDDNTGTFYGVVDSAGNISGITAAQIKLGDNNMDANAVAACSDTVSTTSPSCGVTGLTANTAYSYAVVQNNANGDSDVETGTFTTAEEAAGILQQILHHRRQQQAAF